MEEERNSHCVDCPNESACSYILNDLVKTCPIIKEDKEMNFVSFMDLLMDEDSS